MHRNRKILLIALGIVMLAVAVLAFLFLNGKSVTLEEAATAVSELVSAEEPKIELPTYIEVLDGCGADFSGSCVNIRMEATTSAPAIGKLRTGTVLPIAKETETDASGRVWYKVEFSEWIRYKDRVAKDWYVASDQVRAFYDPGTTLLLPGDETTTKRIVVDRSEQMLYAYDGEELALKTTISTGHDLTPTPRGSFRVFKKTPSRYMQGPLPDVSEDYYDLPGVPWNMYFTKEGGAIHGAYWHTKFGQQWSHGCVNVPLAMARELYEWAPLGTAITVQD
ncbi:MAG: L,D-transpeptidase family protein [Patescibacteria group bacterium]